MNLKYQKIILINLKIIFNLLKMKILLNFLIINLQKLFY